MGDGTRVGDDPATLGRSRQVADRIVGITNPATVLDVGCSDGPFLQALRERGVDASGFDVAATPEPIEGSYSLVTCVGVLEHLAPGAAQEAIDRITAVTDRVLFSADPGNHREPTHLSSRPTAQWAAAFAERGFFRRTDVDLSFLTPWAVLFERAALTVHELAHRYESQHAAMQTELVEKRAALLETHRRLSEAQEGHPTQAQLAEQAALLERWEAEVLEARHQVLTLRDHVIGTEAEVTRLRRDDQRLRRELMKARKQLRNVRGRLQDARDRAQRLARQNQQLTSELEALRGRPTVARRVARKVLGGRR